MTESGLAYSTRVGLVDEQRVAHADAEQRAPGVVGVERRQAGAHVGRGVHPEVEDAGGGDDRARGVEQVAQGAEHVAADVGDPQRPVAERFQLGGRVALLVGVLAEPQFATPDPDPTEFHGRHRHRRRPASQPAMSGADKVPRRGGLQGKTAIVTGAASGIGRATAKALADVGATVTLSTSRRAGRQRREEAGGTYAHLDVSPPDAWAELLAGFDRLDYLHLNAGIYDTALADITQISDARYRAYLGVNVDGVFFGLRSAIPRLEPAKGAVVVTIVDGGGRPAPRQPVVHAHEVLAHRVGARHPR